MSEWKELILDRIAVINPTESLKKGVLAKKVAMDVLQPFTKKISSYSIEAYNGGMKFRNGDTIVARITPCLENGKTAYIDILGEDEVGYGSTEYIVIRERKEVSDKHFLYYFSISQEFRDVAILSMTGSSGRQRVQTDVVRNHTFLFPSLDEQRGIASVLSSLDEKINLLQRQNRTLKAMAETLFRQWFMEEAVTNPTNQILLGDLIESVSVTHTFSKPTVIFLNTSDIYLGSVLKHSYDDVKDLPGQAKKSITKGDILFSEIRPANGRFAYIDFDADDYVVSTKLMVLRSKGILSQAFVYFFLTNRKTTEWLQTLAEARSGTFPQITFEQLRDLIINVPSKEMLQTVSELCIDWLRKIKFNQLQIRTLEKLRDTLLPKLMSGEVRVEI